MPLMDLLIPVHVVSTYKSRELLPLKCEHCDKIFYKRKGDVVMSLKGHPDFALRFCSLMCHHLHRVKITHVELPCEQCGKAVVKQKSWVKGNKHNFCSRSCSATFQNIHKTLGAGRKSKSEVYLAELIRADYKNFELLENSRSILPSGLELDLFLPAFSLAIELNGPLHSLPLFGVEKLRLIQDKDVKKQVEAQAVGCTLIVVDTSPYKYWPETKRFLDREYKTNIKPLIQALLTKKFSHTWIPGGELRCKN